ncbi:MAG: carotenoid biosynthesis protein [Deltaproteobacteria bacterium]|nr:carotenoid biosynthesis protein [Deltaproteobacteria bacterium]
MHSLFITIQNRPYVVAFLLAFLLISLLNRGVARTLLFLIIGYTVAFLSEFCSIRWGFPYGMYHYIYENMPGELILAGVPVWDSISYVFMAYASYEMANWVRRGGWRLVVPLRPSSDAARGDAGRQDPPLLISSLLMTLLDVVTDPLAVRGDQWFLGKIFYYPNGGIYFGVPLSNFAGWFLVGLMIFLLYALIERKLPHPQPLSRIRERVAEGRARASLLGPLFYLSIVMFNVAITIAIGEWRLASVSSLIFLGITSSFARGVLRRRN